MVNIIKTFQPAYKWERKPSRLVRIWCLLISSFFYLTAAINTANAATYYLDAANGDNSNPGTSDLPWKSLAKAKTAVVAGDTVILRDGNYGYFDQKNIGYDNWVTYKADAGHTPVFTRLWVRHDDQSDLYLRFDGITFSSPMPAGNDPDNGPWTWARTNFPADFTKVRYVELLNCIFTSENKYLTTIGVSLSVADNVTINHCEVTNTLAGIGCYDCKDLIITNNYIHGLSKGSGIRLLPGVDPNRTSSLIEGNNLSHISDYDKYDEYYPPEILWVALGEAPWDDSENPPNFNSNDVIIQGDITARFKGVWWNSVGSRWQVYVIMLTGLGFAAEEECAASISGITFTPYQHYEQFHIGSGLAIKVPSNVTMRNNIIHDFRGQGIYLYANKVHQNMIVENNLLYDIGSYTYFSRLVGPTIIRNNTFIGGVSKDNHTGGDYTQILGRHSGGIFLVGFESGFDGTGVEIYNNIIVGSWEIPDPEIYNHVENNNIWWVRGGNAGLQLDNTNSIVAVWKEDIFVLHGYPEYFEDLDGFTQWTSEYPAGSTPIPFFVNPGFYTGTIYDPPNLPITKDRGKIWDYYLAAGSPGINFGDPTNQPNDSLGTIGPDGFIRDDGLPRDTSHHSAGCYEYVSSDPNNPTPVLQAIGDKSVDENVALTFTVNATDPNGEPITYSAQGLPSGATLDPLTGEFDWTPSYTQAGSYQVTFRASDGNSWDSETITITVNNVNRPPVLGAITDQSVDENDILSLSVNASDPDGQALTYSISGLPAGAVFVSQTLTWTPSYDQAGTFPVTFAADDGQAQDSEAITITVINVNRTPVLTAIDNQSVWADDPLTFTIDATDPDGDAVTYSAGNLPSDATFTSQDFDWTPSQGQMGSYDVTFIASDGQLQDSQTVTITVDVDSLAPTITNLSPTAGSIQVPLNNLITLNVTDAGKGVNANSVKIKVKTNSNPNNNTVYFGDMDHYISLLGDCRRIGSNADYKFVFQPTQDLFYYDQTVTITVNATDLAGNVMDEYSYSFATEMHSFGQNKQVNSGLDNNDRPVTVCDSSGNIWTAWHTGSIGNRDIYVSKLAAGEENFGGTIQLTDNTNDQCNPAVALDSNDKLYVVWQDNREGDWDIYISTSVDGTSWSTETRVNDPNEDNQVNPAIVIDGQSPNQAYVVWQDDRAGSQDICVATSSDGFVTTTVSQITSHISDQVEPAVTADFDNTIYVVWTDGRNGSNDIYGATSNNPWTNVAIVSNANNQSSPTIAAESVGAILHLLWVDDTLGDKDIYYASSDGLPGSPLTGSSIIDDTSGADQLEPAIAVTGSTGNNLKVFACWQDWRNTDTDLYFAELSSSSGTNVFVGDGGSSTYQGEPVIGIDEYSHPYLIWADNRSTNTEIYYAGSTFVEPVALASELVAASAPSSTTVGADPQAITTVDDVSVVVPAGACSYDVAITVTKIANPQAFAAPCLGGYDFGPSGIQFSQPVTITIPYFVSESNGSTLPYWYNSLTGALSQQGITGVQDIVISPTLHALSFKTTHFTAFYLLGGGAAVLGGGGGGGCSVSAGGEGNMVEFALPYIGLVVVMAILKVRDARERKARNT